MTNWTMSLQVGDRVVLRKVGKGEEFEAEVARVGKQQLVAAWHDGKVTREAKYLRSSGQPYGYNTNATLVRRATTEEGGAG